MKKLGLILALALVLGSFVGCGSDLPAVYVQSVADIVGYGTIGEVNRCAGVTVAGNEVDIQKDSDRSVVEIKVEVGQTVSAGDVLFVYDTEEIKLSLDKAELEIEQLKNSVTDLENQIAQLEKEKKSAASSAQLGYTVQIQSLQADKRETEYNITVKERELESLKATDTDGAVKAEIDGEIKEINEDGGYDNYTGKELPFMTIVETGALRVKGKINELNRDDYYVGMPVILRSRADETQTWSGTIDSVDTNPEENNNNYYYYDSSSDDSSSNYPFYVALDSSDGLILGQHVYIEPYSESDTALDGLWLDASFVMEEDGAYYVWAADGKDRIEKRALTVAQFDEMRYAYCITDGLTVEDRIAFPNESIQEGAPVTDEPIEESVYEDTAMDIDEGAFDDGIYEDGIYNGDAEADVDGDYAIGDDDYAIGDDDFAVGDGETAVADPLEEGELTQEAVSEAAAPSEGGAD